MSKLRSLSTAFWSDPFIEDLTPQQKLLFIYLITNDKTNMLGIYENSIRKMSFETGINKSEIEKALKEFESKGKVKYINNYVVLINYMKHQNFNTNMKKSAIDTYNNLPSELRDKKLVVSKSNPLEGFESLLNHYGMVSKIEVEYELELESKLETKEEEEFTNTPVVSQQTDEEIDFKTLLEFINNHTGRKFKVINEATKKKYKARIKEGYTAKDIGDAIKNAVKAKNHIENGNQYLTPEFFSRADKLNLYSQEPKNINNEKSISKKPTLEELHEQHKGYFTGTSD